MRRLGRCLVAVVLLALLAAPASRAASPAERAGSDAYVYGFPLLLERATLARLPVNSLIGLGQLATPRAQLVVLPNNDTAYALASLDLSREPLVLHMPDTGGRYDVFQLLDAYTTVFANPGRRLNGTAAQDVAITGPGWTGTLPPGVRRVASPTPHAWLLGRVLVDGPSDLPAVRALLARFTLNPLSAYGTPGASTSSIVLTSFPSLARPQIPRGQAFLDALAAALAADPPPARDAPLLRRLARYGIRPGAAAHASSAVLRGLAAGARQVAAARGRVNRSSARAHQGWLVPPRRTGRFGTDYELRAITARYALGANVAEETVYGLALQDSAGRPLSGAHGYRVRFAPGQLPPVRAFWSLTMYGSNLFLVDNPLGRYSLGDRSPGLRRARDGSLTIAISRRRPPGPQGNWLPAPSGRFVLALRLYNPKARVLAGRWPFPRVTRVGR